MQDISESVQVTSSKFLGTNMYSVWEEWLTQVCILCRHVLLACVLSMMSQVFYVTFVHACTCISMTCDCYNIMHKTSVVMLLT